MRESSWEKTIAPLTVAFVWTGNQSETLILWFLPYWAEPKFRIK